MPTSSQQSTASPNSPLAGTFKQLRLDRDLHSRTMGLEEKLEDVTMSDGDDVRGRQEGESEREKQKQKGRESRPTLGRRTTSYSKRHSSLDTPREVPAPFRFFDDRPTSTTSSHAHHQPTHSAPSNAPPGLESDVPLHEDDQPPAYDSAPTQQLPSPPLLAPDLRPPVNKTSKNMLDHGADFIFPPSLDSASLHDSVVRHTRDGSGSSATNSRPASPRAATPTPVYPFNRPFSSPSVQSPPLVPPSRFQPANPNSPTWYDRNSTASLPPMSQTPFYTLPSFFSPPQQAQTLDQHGSADDPVPGPSSVAPQMRDTPMDIAPSSASSSAVAQGHPPSSSASSTISSASSMTAPPAYTATANNASASSAAPPSAGLFRSHSEYSPSTPAARIPVVVPPPTIVQPSPSIPPPAPPTILAAPAPPGPERSNHYRPHEPFLAHAPPPPDTWIAVETLTREYNLVVRLPGFRRDGITLATRRRRVLHLVADSWESGGGHFERRISFGYDADLAQVRAEFDGDLLRVIIPRRMPSMTWYGEARD